MAYLSYSDNPRRYPTFMPWGKRWCHKHNHNGGTTIKFSMEQRANLTEYLRLNRKYLHDYGD